MRIRLLILTLLLLTPALMVRASNGNANGRGLARGPAKARGQKTGDYSLTLVGDYMGSGSGSVTATTVSLSAVVTMPDGSSAALAFPNMPRVNDRFQGAATCNGIAFTLFGRVDLPAATDAEQTPAQAVTGRVTALLGDSTGNGARLVAIQNQASRGVNTGNTANDNGGDNGNGMGRGNMGNNAGNGNGNHGRNDGDKSRHD